MKHDLNFLICRFGDFFQQDMFYLEDLGVMESIMKEYLPDFAVRGKFKPSALLNFLLPHLQKKNFNTTTKQSKNVSLIL